MTEADRKADLHGYLRAAREAVLVKHLATLERGHFGAAFGRPFEESLPWVAAWEGYRRRLEDVARAAGSRS